MVLHCVIMDFRYLQKSGYLRPFGGQTRVEIKYRLLLGVLTSTIFDDDYRTVRADVDTSSSATASIDRYKRNVMKLFFQTIYFTLFILFQCISISKKLVVVASTNYKVSNMNTVVAAWNEIRPARNVKRGKLRGEGNWRDGVPRSACCRTGSADTVVDSRTH